MAALLHRHLFGIKVDAREPIWYVDDQTVLYPAGHNTVIFNLEQRIQRFLPGTDRTEEITAVAVSPNKKFVAVAEKSDKGVITVFDLHSLKRRRLLTATDSLSKVRRLHAARKVRCMIGFSMGSSHALHHVKGLLPLLFTQLQTLRVT